MWSVDPNKTMTVPQIQKSKNLAVTLKNKAHFNQNHICDNYTSKPVKTTKIDQAYHKHLPNKHYTKLGGCNW